MSASENADVWQVKNSQTKGKKMRVSRHTRAEQMARHPILNLAERPASLGLGSPKPKVFPLHLRRSWREQPRWLQILLLLSIAVQAGTGCGWLIARLFGW